MNQSTPVHKLAEALEQHASGLRLSFYGLLMMVGGLLGALPWLLAPLLKLERALDSQRASAPVPALAGLL